MPLLPPRPALIGDTIGLAIAAILMTGSIAVGLSLALAAHHS
jgi:hypothetical protein